MESSQKPVQEENAQRTAERKKKEQVKKAIFSGMSVDSDLKFNIDNCEMHENEQTKVIDECRKRELLPLEVLTAAQYYCMTTQNARQNWA